jgi:hypothetical protein
MSYTLDFLFIPQDKRGLLHDVQIYVKTHSKSKKGHILLTLGECLRQAEIDYEIDRLIKELEEIRKKVRKKFENNRKKLATSESNL